MSRRTSSARVHAQENGPTKPLGARRRRLASGWKGLSAYCFALATMSEMVVGSPTSRCTWLHLSGGTSHPDVMGIYERSPNQTSGRDVWIQGSVNAQIRWSGKDWVVATRWRYFYATENSSNATSALSDPLLFNGTWSQVIGSSMPMPEGSSRVEEPALVLRCLATLDEFAMSYETRELWSFGSNFFGELARGDNTLTTGSNPSPQRITSSFGSLVIDSIAAGCSHGLALSTAGELWAWGSNTVGQLGQTRGVGQSSANPSPRAVDGSLAFVSAVGGGSFSVARQSSGRVVSMGSNQYGQLGRPDNLGADTWTNTPGAVVGLESVAVVQVAAGKYHCLALSADGHVLSWGSNRYGQLGRASNAGSDAANGAPMAVDAGAMMNASVAAMAAGRFHSLLLTDSGMLYTAGSNLRGQVGPESAGSRAPPGSSDANAVPTLVPASLFGGQAVASVWAGQFFSLAQTADGQVWGFGRNYFGQLSNAAVGVGLSIPVASPVCITCSSSSSSSWLGLRATMVAAGADHTLLVVTDDQGTATVRGLGSNVYGQLGTAHALGSGTADPVAVGSELTACSAELLSGDDTGGRDCLTGRMEVRQLATECDQTLVLTQRPACPPGSMSEAATMGLQPCSPCPAGTFQPAAAATACLPCAQSSVSSGGSKQCVACPAGQNTSAEETAVGGCLDFCPVGTFGVQQAVGNLGLSPCTSCAADSYADENGTVACKPCPAYSGSVRSGLTSGSECRDFCAPGNVSSDGLAPCRQCPAGTFNSDWRMMACEPCPVGFFSEEGSSACTVCAAGSFAPAENSSSCTLCSFGTYQPREGQTECIACSGFKSAPIRGAANESDCLPTVWQMWGAGNNMWGQLGSGFTSNVTAEINFEAVQVASDPSTARRGLDDEDVIEVSAGFSHSLFVTVNRRLWAAGNNDYGQLGSPPAARPACQYADAPDLVCRYDPTPNAVPTEVDARLFNRTVATARAGRHFSVVVTHDGRLWSMGLNAYGQLGRPDMVGDDNVGAWEVKEVMPDVVDVAVGWYHVLALTADGALMTFGLNRFGQLGVEQNQGTWLPNPDPLTVPRGAFGGGEVTAIAAGGTFSMVLTSEGEVWTFGSNQNGQLGVSDQFGLWRGVVWVPHMVPQVWMEGDATVTVVGMAAGARHAIVQSSDGKLWGFGSNLYGQLASVALIGDQTSTPARLGLDLPSFGLDNTPLLDSSTVVAFACGSDFTMVQTDDFRLWLFGANRYGQLLREENAGEWEFNPEPQALVPCGLFDDQSVCDGYIVTNFSAGGEHTMVITGSRSCPPGSKGPPPFGRPGQLGDCETCPAGTASAGAGSTTCTLCTPGSAAPAGSETCSVCPRNTYASGSGNGACTPCPAEERTAGVEATALAECRAECRAGHYSTGTVIDGSGHEPCLPCAAGTFSGAAGAMSCSLCAAGEWSYQAATDCSTCPAGTSTYPGPGSDPSDCTDICPAGTRSDTGLAPCSECPRGSTSGAQAQSCLVCAAGSDTAANGSSTCVAVCPAGSFGDVVPGLQPCSTCLAGTFAPARSSACLPCAPGNFSALNASAQCARCLPGSFSDSSAQTACELCSPGYAQSLPGQTACAACQRGTFSDAVGAGACSACPPGQTSNVPGGATGCVPCTAGTAFNDVTAACDECPAGTYALPQAASCQRCPIGTYGPTTGASTCLDCMLGTTASVGSTAATDCRGLTQSSVAVAREGGLPKAGAPASLVVRFTPLMDIATGEEFVLGLPGMVLRGGPEVEVTGATAGAVTARWHNASEERPYNSIIFSVMPGQSVERLNSVEIEVAEAVGVSLPALGITSLSLPITLATNAAAGLVPATPVDDAPTVGSFGDSSTVVWDGSWLSVAAMPMMQMAAGDRLVLALPIMLRSSAGGQLPLTYMRRLSGLFGVNATWSHDDNTLHLSVATATGATADPPVPAESTVAVMVGGLTLLPGPWASSEVTIASDAVAGPVPPTTVHRVCRQEPGTPTMCCSGASPTCLYA